MGEKINRIRINRLYSSNNLFDEIIFHDGVNLILGENLITVLLKVEKQMV